MKTGAEIIIDCLKREGVNTIFGYPGGQIIPFYDKLYDSDLRHILVRHEQGAAHAADGYARATGKVGVCVATSGPGATNLVTGIATAYMDSVPIVAITGQVKSHLLGKDAFQEADIVGITLSIVKHSYIVKDINQLASTIKEAFYIAKTGRPGPVLIDIPSNIQLEEIEYCPESEINLNGYSFDREDIKGDVSVLFDMLKESKKPLICAGGGIITSGAAQELAQVSEKLQIPVITTLMGIGTIDAEHPLCFGMTGMHGTKYANYAVCNCDLLIAIGTRFDDRATGAPDKFAPGTKKIHIDIDPSEINKIIQVDAGIIGDAKIVLSKILKQANEIDSAFEHNEWIGELNNVKVENPLKYGESDILKPQYVIEQIYEMAGDDGIVTTDVGTHQMWAAQYNKSRKQRKFITSGGLGTMGFGLPAAIGAKSACPDKNVFCISGDGSIQMNSQEIMTSIESDLPVIVAIMNNGHLGMVRQWQQLLYNERYSCTNIEKQPDFVKLAECYGAVGIRVTLREEVIPAIEKAIACGKTAIIDFIVEREENVYPFVPGGSALDNMIGG